MPWCHHCNAEFREGIFQCTTCNRPLVAEPPVEGETDEIDDDALLDSDVEVTVVGRGDFGSVMEYRTAFHDGGIPCAIVREEPEADAPAERRHHARFEILIPVDRLEDAAKVLGERGQEMLAREGLQPVTPADDIGKCPACGFSIAEDAKECPDCGLAIAEA